MTSIDLSSFDFSSVTTAIEMFNSCTNLEHVTLPNHMTSLQSAKGMFASCSSLKYINLDFLEFNRKFNDANHMFRNCSSLIEMKFPEVYSYEGTDLAEMFSGCFNLKSVDLGNYGVKYISGMSMMFYNCKKLEYIDIFNLNMKNIEPSKRNSIFEGVGKYVTKKVVIIYNEYNVDEEIEKQIKNITNKLSA